MDAIDLLQQLQQKGIEVGLTDKGKLRLESNEPIPPELVEKIKAHKQELIEALSNEGKANPIASLTPSLKRRLETWGCRNCSWLLSDDEPVCVVEDKKSIHMVTISRLRECPKRNKQIYYAILRGDHLSWLN